MLINTKAAEYIAVSMASAQRYGLDAQAGLNALQDILSPGNGVGGMALTHGAGNDGVGLQNLPVNSPTGGIQI